MSTIYGFYGGGHNSSTTLMVDGKIVHCVEEERMNRIKAGNYHEDDFPILSSNEIAKRTGIPFRDTDHMVFVKPTILSRIREHVGYNFDEVSCKFLL